MRGRFRPFLRVGALIACGLMLAVVSGCEDDSGDTSYVVTYIAGIDEDPEEQDPDGALTKVVYRDAGGIQREVTDFGDSPRSWSTVLTMAGGDSFFLRTEGSLAGARLVAQVGVEPLGGNVFARTTATDYESDGEIWWVEIPQETLP